ncbi:hypothetical protein PCANC_05950 [Puccinia coronata f. sp. avenae]|uniref:Uncharacterized protein n=1 Tax=Puccinia coronata f. sp. avenae TaxID=200324 RepID=A0A2N5VY26_9BASI|nr:hypothetical protein PCANC_05950 [Puccinia coronata f. sp. avenae]
MDFNQRKRSSATPIPMTPQPAVLPVEALGAAANALPSIPLPATKRDNSPEMGLEEARKELMLPKTTGPQRPGGNNPVPLIDSLEDQAQIALIMLNTHYDSYVGANNRRQLAIAEMHLRKCISAQETLRSWVGNSMTITLSQGWSAKYQLFKLKEWMQQNMPRTPNHQDQSLTMGTRNQGHLQLPQQGIPKNGNQFTQENSPPNFSHQSTNANTAHYPAANHTPGYYPLAPMINQQDYPVNHAPGYYPQAPMTNQPVEAVPPFQGPYKQHPNQQHRSHGKRNGLGWRSNNNLNKSRPSSERGLERMMATAEFLQRALAYMDQRGRSKSTRSNRRQK